MSLVEYAGFDPDDAIETRLRDLKRQNPYAVQAYHRFLGGEDTADLAKAFSVPEARVLEWVNVARSNRLGLRSPYGRRP